MGENKKLKHIPLIGDVMEHVGYSPVDYFSWGHVAMGIVSFLLFSLFITIPRAINPTGELIIDWWFILVLILIVAVGWELIENFIFYKWGIKFEGRRDSIYNSLSDIIFVMGGGALMWLFKWIIMDAMGEEGRWFYLIGLISFGVVMVGYFIGYFITSKKTRKVAKKKKVETVSKTEKFCPDCGEPLIFISKGVYKCEKCGKTVVRE